MSFVKQYRDLLCNIILNGIISENQRTKTKTKVLIGQSIKTEPLYKAGLPLIDIRRIYPHVAAAELAWTLSGSEDITWLLQYTKMWEKFAINNKIQPAYGQRWAKQFGRDQIQELIELFKRDPTSRQGLVMAWDPTSDGLMGIQRPNIPCPFAFSLYALDKYLDIVVYVRSSDTILGLPYDIMHYALLLDALAAELGYKPATVTIFLGHAHIYEPHMAIVKCLLSNPAKPIPKVMGIGLKINDILKSPDEYVKAIREAARLSLHPDSPSLDIVI